MMRYLNYAFAIVSLTAAIYCAAQERPEDPAPGVLDLTPDNFDKEVNGKKGVLVEFYAPWCGHCKSLAGDYKKLGKAVSEDALLNSRVAVAKVNADEFRSLGDRFDVGGYPTLKFFPRGVPAGQNVEDYSRARSTEGMLNFLKEKAENDLSNGRVEALDHFAREFVDENADTADVISRLKAKVLELGEEEKENAEIYIKLMEKAVANGKDYLANEKARVDRLISNGSMKSEKLASFLRKLNILSAFLDEDL